MYNFTSLMPRLTKMTTNFPILFENDTIAVFSSILSQLFYPQKINKL